MDADNTGDAYARILAKKYNYEVPDCGHPVRHITEAYDNELKKYVFVFTIHKDLDDDRCIYFDRQRNEIKTDAGSPDNMKGAYGETHTYRWKFKLDSAFQANTNFTHIHQLKAGDGTFDTDNPLITLTPRKGTPDKLEVIFITPIEAGAVTIKLATVDLAPFKGAWVEVYEKVKYTETGTYQVIIKRVGDQQELLNYSNNNIAMWRTGITFVRPKYGIYRSLLNLQNLRDETVKFADFSLAEGETVNLPAAPSSLVSTPISYNQINLTWADNSINEDQFRIDRSADGLTWSYLATSAANSTSFSDIGLNASTTYYYRIRSENTFGNSGYSNIVSSTTPKVQVISASTGNWSSASTWTGGSVPATTEDALIVSGHTITLDIGDTVSSLTINPGGALTVSASRTLFGEIINKGTITISGASTTLSTKGKITCSGSGAIITFSNSGGKISGTAGDTILLANGGTVDHLTTTTTSSTPLSYIFTNMTWLVDNSISNTNIIYRAGSNYTITPVPNSQTYGNLSLRIASGASGSRIGTLSGNLNLNGNLDFQSNATGSYTLTVDLNGYSINGSGSTSALGVSLANRGLIINCSGINNFTNFNSVNFNPVSGTASVDVNYTSATPQNITAGSYNKLTSSGGGVKSLSGNISVSNTLTLTSGIISLGTYNLTLGTNATISGTASSSNMIAADGSGYLLKSFSSTGLFTYPIGDNIGTAEYSPVTLNFTSGTFNSAIAGVRVSNTKHISNYSTSNYLNRYWSVTQSGISGFNCNATFKYVMADLSGNEADLYCGKYDSTTWSLFSVTNTGTQTLTANGLTSFSDFTAGEMKYMGGAGFIDTKVIIEGLFDKETNLMRISDTVTAELRSITSPFTKIDSARAVIDSSTFTGRFEFLNAVNGSYYLVIKHRNGLETWSKEGGEAFTKGRIISYDFTTDSAKAYGNNMVKKGAMWCIYSGDVNHDGQISLDDLLLIDTDNQNFETGYLATDVNGDGQVTLDDLLITDSNNQNFVSVQKP